MVLATPGVRALWCAGRTGHARRYSRTPALAARFRLCSPPGDGIGRARDKLDEQSMSKKKCSGAGPAE